MADIALIRSRMATAVSTISGLRGMAYEAAKVVPPQAHVGEPTITYDLAMQRGCDQIDIKLRVYVALSDERSGQKMLDGYVSGSGASSVKAALEADKTLGGACDDLRVTSMSGYGFYQVGNAEYLGAEFSVSVLASGV